MKKFLHLVFSLFIATIFSTSAFAAVPNEATSPSFMIAPTSFKGGIPFVYTLAPGSKMTNTMRVTNSSDQEISLDLTVVLPEENPMEWLTLDNQTLVIPAEAYEDVSFEINVPDTAEIGKTFVAKVSVRMTPDENVQEGEVGDETGLSIDVATAYAVNLKVNVGTGEPMSIDNSPSEQWSNLWPWIKENINTILLGLILILMAKVAFCRGGKVVKVAKKKK